MLFRRFTLLILSVSSVATAFVAPKLTKSQVLRPLFSSEADATTVPLVISGRNLEVTDALTDHVKKRIGNVVNKLSGNNVVKECDVILSVSKNPKVNDR